VPDKTLVACSASLRTTAAFILLASATHARAAEPVLSHSAHFLADHGVSAAFVDPDWTKGVAQARAIYSDFILRGQPVPPSVVALDYPTTSSNRVELKVGVEASWGAILDSLKGAQRSIDITMIGWQVDELVPFHRAEKFGFALIDTLCEAARRGVAVNVAVNDMWFKQKGWYLTGGFDRHFDRAIKKGRCQDARGQKLRYVRGIAWHRPRDFVIGRYDHRKVWIVDGLVAYVGGYTVSDEMRDNMFDAEWELRGPVVAQLQANFLLGMGYARAPVANLVECRSKLGHQGCPEVSAPELRQVLDTYFPPLAERDGRYSKSLTIVQNNSLIRDPRALGVTRFYHHLIATADRHLRLAAPFFTADEIVEDVLDRYRAQSCRLEVEVLFPKRPEHMLIWGYKSRNALKRLVQGTEAIRRDACGGVGEKLVVRQFRGDGDCRDYGKRGRLHGKVLTSDSYASIGSANLDGVSLERNLELNVVSTDAGLIERVDQEFFAAGGSPMCADAMIFPKAPPASPPSSPSERP
jgi:phosphatidylserine/phosphatidylglycerophosphate/cardiolipin synthase-like enzyme